MRNRNIRANANTNVGSPFAVSGVTLPGSRVHVVASGETRAFGGLLQIATKTFHPVL